MTRLYLQGRTETVRSLTIEAKDFVRAFVDETVSPEEKYKLLVKAAELHAKMYKDCMNGKGIDRHLFALYVVCRGQGYVSIKKNYEKNIERNKLMYIHLFNELGTLTVYIS